VLKDGRFATGSDDGSIIIYNNQTFEPDIIIRDHFGEVYCILQLSSGILASCSKDKTIKLFSINKYEYNVIQTIKIFKDINNDYYERYYIVKEIIELKNKNLIFYSPGEIYFF
jgi:WD40 repeat protein